MVRAIDEVIEYSQKGEKYFNCISYTYKQKGP